MCIIIPVEQSHFLNGKQNEMWIYVDAITSSEYQLRQEFGWNSKGFSDYFIENHFWRDLGRISCTKMLAHILQ